MHYSTVAARRVPMTGTEVDADPAGLRRWQVEAHDTWIRAGRRGVVEATTASGKTRLAIAAIRELRTDHANVCIAVVVPTLALARQWRTELEKHLPARSSEIGELHSGATSGTRWSGQSMLIISANTARDGLARVRARWRELDATAPVLLVVDECHRLGSPENARALAVPVDFTLGLSATPERDDLGDEAFVYPSLGDVIFRYPLREALKDEVVADVRAVNLYVEFNDAEKAEWRDLEREVARLSRVVLQNRGPTSRPQLFALARTFPGAARLVELLREQELLIDTCTSRAACVGQIVDWIEAERERTLVFHETIAAAEKIYDELRARGVSARIDHSGLDRRTRVAALADFKDDRAQVLVAVRALDEGIDVPDARVAVIAAGSRTRRQRVQRIGRVARRAEDKDTALVITVLAVESPEARIVGSRDQTLLGPGRVTHHRWPATSIRDAVQAPSSTTEVLDGFVAGDRALVAFLGLDEPEPEVFEMRVDHERADQLLDTAAKDFRERNWSGYRTTVEGAFREIAELGGRWDTWLDSVPTPPPPERELAGRPAQLVAGALGKARNALRTGNQRGLTQALQHLILANQELWAAANRDEEHSRSLEEDVRRTRLTRLIDDARSAIDASPIPVGRLTRIRREFQADCSFDSLLEERRLRTELNQVFADGRDVVLNHAEALAGSPRTPASFRQMGELRATWVALGGTAAGRSGKVDMQRMKIAVRTLLLELVEEAEELVGRPDPGAQARMQRIRQEWSATGYCLDSDLQNALKRRLDEACSRATAAESDPSTDG